MINSSSGYGFQLHGNPLTNFFKEKNPEYPINEDDGEFAEIFPGDPTAVSKKRELVIRQVDTQKYLFEEIGVLIKERANLQEQIDTAKGDDLIVLREFKQSIDRLIDSKDRRVVEEMSTLDKKYIQLTEEIANQNSLVQDAVNKIKAIISSFFGKRSVPLESKLASLEAQRREIAYTINDLGDRRTRYQDQIEKQDALAFSKKYRGQKRSV